VSCPSLLLLASFLVHLAFGIPEWFFALLPFPLNDCSYGFILKKDCL
jgi:hypothetical protein